MEAEMRLEKVSINVSETRARWPSSLSLPALTAEEITIELLPECIRFWAHQEGDDERDYTGEPVETQDAGTSQQKNSGLQFADPAVFLLG